MKLWCVSPLLRDVPAFLLLRDGVLEQMPRLRQLGVTEARFIICDDSAGEDPDVRSLHDRQDIIVHSPPHNLGHQRGIVFALRLSKHLFEQDDVIVTLDSDGEDRPEDVPVLAAALLEFEAGAGWAPIVLARRTHRTTTLKFKFLYSVFVLLFSTLTGTLIRSGNFACFRAALLLRIIGHPFFDQCYSSSLVALPIRKRYVPCPRGRRLRGQSKMSVSDLIIHGLRMLMPFVDRIAVRMMMLSAASCSALLLLLMCLLAKALAAHQITLEMTIAGVSLFSLGLLLFANFIMLFTAFSHSNAILLKGLELEDRRL